MSQEVYVVVMAGGAGTRFWPKSRQKNPKQFLKLLGRASLLQDTVLRATRFVAPEHCLILTDQAYFEQVKESLPEIPLENIVLEPVNRDTAPCLALAALKILALNKDALMVVLPSDHYISDEGEFLQALQTACNHAANHDDLVTIGIEPLSPATSYGYVGFEHVVGEFGTGKVLKVIRFIEKPPAAVAASLLREGNFLWNSGIFVWQARVLLANIEKYLPELFGALNEFASTIGTEKEADNLAQIYPTLPRLSIDYAIMEKAKRVVVVPGSFQWDDVGSWSALEKYLPKDERNNVVNSNYYVALDTSGCIIDCQKGLVATIGLKDLIIIQMDDVLLVAKKDRDQDVKQLVAKMEQAGLHDYL